MNLRGDIQAIVFLLIFLLDYKILNRQIRTKKGFVVKILIERSTSRYKSVNFCIFSGTGIRPTMRNIASFPIYFHTLDNISDILFPTFYFPQKKSIIAPQCAISLACLPKTEFLGYLKCFCAF